MKPNRRSSGPLPASQLAPKDTRSKPRASLDSTALSAQFEEHKRHADDMAGEVWAKINQTREQRRSRLDRYSPNVSPRGKSAHKVIADEKEMEEVRKPPKGHAKKPVTTAPPLATVPVHVPAAAPAPGLFTMAPVPMAAPLPGGMPPMPMAAPMPGMPMMAPPPPGVSMLVGPATLHNGPTPVRYRAFNRDVNRLRRHRFRYYRSLTLAEGYTRIMCETVPNTATQIICDIVTVYGGLNALAHRPKPNLKMKTLHWKKLKARNVERSSFWSSIVENSMFIDVAKLEQKFFYRNPVTRDEAEREKKEKSNEPEVYFTITHGKVVAISVMLKISRLDVPVLMRYIRAMDDEHLNVRELYSLAPSDEEIAYTLNEAAKYPSLEDVLAVAKDYEKFWWELCNIPRLKIRLQLWLFKLEFEEEVEHWAEQLEILRRAVSCIKDSGNLKVFFSAVLAVGNFLNDGNRRTANAEGVSLSVLSALDGMRESVAGSRQTLLTYLYEILEERAPQVLGLEDDLQPIELLDRFDWAQMDSCKVMDRALNDMHAVYREVFQDVDFGMDDTDEKDRDPDDTERDRYFEVMGAFFTESLARVRSMVDEYDQTLTDIGTLQKDFFAERLTPDEFFWTWLEFLDSWRRTKDSIALRIRKEENQKRLVEIRRLRKEEQKRRREAMALYGDGEKWTYQQRFALTKEQLQHCSSPFFLSYLQKNFMDFGQLSFDPETETLLVVVDDGEQQPEGMEILKIYLGELVEFAE